MTRYVDAEYVNVKMRFICCDDTHRDKCDGPDIWIYLTEREDEFLKHSRAGKIELLDSFSGT